MPENATWAQNKIIASVKDIETIIGKDLELLSGDSFYGNDILVPEYKELQRLATEIKKLLQEPSDKSTSTRRLQKVKKALPALFNHIKKNSEKLDSMMSLKRSNPAKGYAQVVKSDSNLRSSSNEFLTKIKECLSGIDQLFRFNKQSDFELVRNLISIIDKSSTRALVSEDIFKLKQIKNIFQADNVNNFADIQVQKQSESFIKDIANLKQIVQELSGKRLPDNAKLYLEEFSKRLDNYNPIVLDSALASAPETIATLGPLNTHLRSSVSSNMGTNTPPTQEVTTPNVQENSLLAENIKIKQTITKPDQSEIFKMSARIDLVQPSLNAPMPLQVKPRSTPSSLTPLLIDPDEETETRETIQKTERPMVAQIVKRESLRSPPLQAPQPLDEDRDYGLQPTKRHEVDSLLLTQAKPRSTPSSLAPPLIDPDEETGTRETIQKTERPIIAQMVKRESLRSPPLQAPQPLDEDRDYGLQKTKRHEVDSLLPLKAKPRSTPSSLAPPLMDPDEYNTSKDAITTQGSVIPQKVEVDRRKLRSIHEKLMEHLDQTNDPSGELFTKPPTTNLSPQLEIQSSADTTPIKPAPPSLPSSPNTSTSVTSPVKGMPPKPTSTPVSPPLPVSPMTAFSKKLEDLGKDLEVQQAKSIDRQSVLSPEPGQSKGLVFNRENLCRELGQEYSIKENRSITFTEAEENDASTKKLSFSTDGKIVTLPDDNIINNTVYSLNTIARSNMSNINVGKRTASIKIKNVQEQDLLQILEKFNVDILGDDNNMGLKGHLQLSYENTKTDSPNESAIQNIIKQHNDLHSLLKADVQQPEKVQQKLAALQQSINTLKTTLGVQQSAAEQKVVQNTTSRRLKS